MSFRFIHSSPRLAAAYSWLQGTRCRIVGPGHRLQRHNAVLRGTTIELLGANCRVVIGPGARLWDCFITVSGEGTVLVIGPGCRLQQSRLCVEDPGSRLVLGERTSLIGSTLVSQEGGLLQVGEDCMFARGTDVRNSDGHAIYDQANVRLNPGRDVVIGRHVWLALGVCLTKGSRVGDGAVVGALSLVSGEIPAGSIAFGMPATSRRTGIRWDRSRNAPKS